MSDPKRTHLITVGAPKSAKNNVIKTVRLTINLDESNESKYPELNYKELVIAEERKKKVENGKTTGLDPFSDNDDDVERVARKFEQKYGKKSTYGRKGRSKNDDFADIGAGYDENDSFIDNTHGYDEMIPPGCDTLYGGFYINCGSLEFKNVENQTASDGEPGASRRNKRRISSSSSEEESSESSSESESQDAKDGKAVANGEVDLHETEHRKKKNKNIDKKANKIRRTDSSAATSGKQTSDDNNHGDAESADSRTSQSDSMTSKPAPSSENAVTSDSSRDVEAKAEIKLPHSVTKLVEELEATIGKLANNPNTTAMEVDTHTDQYLIRLERALSDEGCEASVRRATYARLSRPLRRPRTKLQHRARALLADSTPGVKRKHPDHHNHPNHLDDNALSQMTADQKEAKIVDTLQKLKALIDERKPSMMASYDLECRRVQEERRKMQSAGTPHAEKRLPKRRFPWCGRVRALLALLARLAGDPQAAAALLALRALPLFPTGFVRMPTLLKQADLSKEIKVTDLKRQRLSPPRSTPTPIVQPPQPFTEPIQFPSSLTVTTSVKVSRDSIDKVDTVASADKDKAKDTTPTVFGNILNTFAISKDLVVENPKKDDKKDDLYVPRNNLGSYTITPVPNNHSKTDKKTVINSVDKKESLIRVKSPAALNEMAIKEKEIASKSDKDKHKKDKERPKEKPVTLPLHIDTHFNATRKDPSPKLSEKSQKQIDSMRVNENNIPRPALIPVHHSPTFAKPDKRAERKKKDILIVSDVDPLGDVQQEPVAIDDSSSDVEVVEEKSDKCVTSDKKSAKSEKSEPPVPLDKVTVSESRKERVDDAINKDIDIVMRNLREMEHSQDTAKFNSNSYGGVITNAKHECSKRASLNARGVLFGDSRKDKDKFAGRSSLNKMDGCNAVTG